MPDDSVRPAEVAEPGAPPPRAEPAGSSSRGSFWRELPFLIVIALVLALLIKTFLVQAFYIPSASMENTLQGGPPTAGASSAGHPYDRVLVNKLVYDFRSPHRGEIVVFKGPPGWPKESQLAAPSNPVSKFFHDVGTVIGLTPESGSSDFIKRVIGVGGDTITCTNDVLRVNGHRLTEPYLYPGSHQCAGDGFNNHRPVRVPQGDVWVMGDHRDDSEDSRVHGAIPVSDVIGRAFVVIWPASDWKTLPVPSTFSQAGLAVGGSGNWILVVLVILAIVVAVVAFVAVHRRRRRASYAAGDGPG